MINARQRLLPLIALLAVAACSSKDASDNAASAPGAPATPAASSSPAGEPTAVDFSNYELTMDKMRKWVAVTKAFATFSGTAADSAAMMTVKIGSDPISESVRKIESIAPAKRMFATAGLDPREYHMITGAWMQAGMMASMMGPNSQAKLPEGHSMKNIEFVNAHKAELEKLMKDAGMSQ